MEEKEKLAIDIFIQETTTNLAEFKKAVAKAKMIMIRDIHLNDRFEPKKYVRYYLTFRILTMADKEPLSPTFNIKQQKIERLQNAALSLDILEMQLQSLKVEEKELYCLLEIGGIYVLSDDTPDEQPWY